MPIRRFRRTLPNRPFRIDAPPINMPLSMPTRDLVHKFYQQPGADRRRRATTASSRRPTPARWSMGYYDGSPLPMWKWAQEYTLADNFFMGAFGGSYLNHFWLICACTPVDRDAPANLRAQLDERGWLKRRPDSPASALTGAPKFVLDGDVTPDGYSVNTTQPPYQPSRVPPGARTAIRASPIPRKHTLPPQTQKTIGDTLSAKGISWAWYAGAWDAALKDGMQPAERQAHGHLPRAPTARRTSSRIISRSTISRASRRARADRARHLKDYTDLVAGIDAGRAAAGRVLQAAGQCSTSIRATPTCCPATRTSRR